MNLLHLRARWYLAETGTFLSRDAVESEPAYLYVSGNPVNFIDPSGYFKCDPITGQCEAGYGLCVVQGVWQGAYVNGKPCIVNPNNVQTGNGPNWPSPPQFTGELPQPSSPTGGGISSPSSTTQSTSGSNVFQAIVNSHSQETDGFIIGGSLAGHLIPLLDVSHPWVGYINGRCLPGTGWTGGLEVVYDFKHQERGIFGYFGRGLNILTAASASATAYMGLARGFANADYGDDEGFGVRAYEGFALAAGVSLSPAKVPLPVPYISPGGGIIVTAPLDKYRNVSPQGVFGTLFGISGSGGGSIIPFAGGDIAVTEARLLYNAYPGRVRYALPFGTTGLSEQEVIERQKSISRRMAAAAMMANEINLIGGSVVNPMVSLAIGKIWGWALRP